MGAEELEDDGIPFEEKVEAITTELAEQFAKSHELEDRIKNNLSKIGIKV